MDTAKTDSGFEYTSIVYPFYEKNALFIHPDKAWSEYSDYIAENKIEQAKVFMPTLSGLASCRSLKYLYILPTPDAPREIDFKPLYSLPEVKFLNCGNAAGDDYQYLSEVDYSYVNGLEVLLTDVNRCTKNYNTIASLKSLGVWSYKGRNGDLEDLFSSTVLDSLSMISCRNRSLYGISRAENLRCLYIHRNRCLEDISALQEVKSTLTALRLESCPKVTDFSVLSELHSLELLELSGSNTIESLDFIRNMPKLKTLILTMNVVDGDLRPCAQLSYVFAKDRRHYNLKDDELPKGKRFFGNEDIESWRRFE